MRGGRSKLRKTLRLRTGGGITHGLFFLQPRIRRAIAKADALRLAVVILAAMPSHLRSRVGAPWAGRYGRVVARGSKRDSRPDGP